MLKCNVFFFFMYVTSCALVIKNQDISRQFSLNESICLVQGLNNNHCDGHGRPQADHQMSDLHSGGHSGHLDIVSVQFKIVLAKLICRQGFMWLSSAAYCVSLNLSNLHFAHHTKIAPTIKEDCKIFCQVLQPFSALMRRQATQG